MNAFFGHAAPVRKARFTPNGKFVVSISEDHTLKLWSVPLNQCKGTIDYHKFHSQAVHCLDFYPAKELVVTGGDDCVFCISSYTQLQTYYKSPVFPSPIQDIVVDQVSGLAVVGCLDGQVEMFNLNSQVKTHHFKCEAAVSLVLQPKSSHRFVAFTAKGKAVVFSPMRLENFLEVGLGVDSEVHAVDSLEKGRLLLAMEKGVVLEFVYGEL